MLERSPLLNSPGSHDPTIPEYIRTELGSHELWWYKHQKWLAEQGYMLRLRYRPGWVPSWIRRPGIFNWHYEDGHPSRYAFNLDAVRISDKAVVMLKRVMKWRNPHEVEITQYLSSGDLRTDPRNRSVPLWDVLAVPDEPETTILVMPYLRACNRPSWKTIGEVLSFIIQIFDAVLYLHERHIAHRDIMSANIMYDPQPMYPLLYHPERDDRAYDFKHEVRYSTRTKNPVKYYLIDFGLSRRYDPKDGPPREHPIEGGDKSVPEIMNWNGELLDPFPTDIYYLGNTLRRNVLEKFRGVEFLKPLIEEMVQVDPLKRPTMQEAVRMFNELLKRVGRVKLRSRLRPVDEELSTRLFKDHIHLYRTLHYVLMRKAAIPIPA